MEFLKHFAKAKEMGISKDDFMSVWQSNMVIERQNAEAKLLELGANIDEALQKKGTKDNMKEPYSNDAEEIKKLRSEFHQMIEGLRSEMFSMHEQLKKQMEEECRLNLDSMKVYVQNEIELLYQNKPDMYSRDSALVDSMSSNLMNGSHTALYSRDSALVDSMSNNLMNGSHTALYSRDSALVDSMSNNLMNGSQTALYSRDSALVDSMSSNLMNGSHTALKVKEVPLQDFNIPQEFKSVSPADRIQTSSLSGTDNGPDIGWEPSNQSKADSYPPVVSRSYAAAAASDVQRNKEEMEQMLKPGSDKSHKGNELQKFGSTYNTEEAKGFIAQIISQQMAQRRTSPSSQSSRSRSRAKKREIIPYHGAAIGKFPSPKTSSISSTSDNCLQICVSNCSKWESSKTDFYTPHHYTIPKKCKVRLQMRFSAKGFLCVNVLLSKGADDENIKWPVKLSGCGEIYNQGSRRFTPIWSIDPQNCSKPGGTLEYSIGATVCLVTSRGTHNNVTLTMLKEKKYVIDDCFTIKWCLKADDEDIPK